MSKTILFSRYFPKGHPKEGKETEFIEKIWENNFVERTNEVLLKLEFLNFTRHEFKPKVHTIRNGNRWEAGDKFSPRVWSGKPYCSKQITICGDLEVKKVYNFCVDEYNDWYINNRKLGSIERIDLAINDGLLYEDMLSWFSKPFLGQIICWSNDVNY
jgi:hypothetical protein